MRKLRKTKKTAAADNSNNIIYRFQPACNKILTFPTQPTITEQDYMSLFVGIIRLIKEDAKREVLDSIAHKND